MFEAGLPKVNLYQDSNGKIHKVLLNGEELKYVTVVNTNDDVEKAVPIVTIQFYATVERETIEDGKGN